MWFLFDGEEMEAMINRDDLDTIRDAATTLNNVLLDCLDRADECGELVFEDFDRPLDARMGANADDNCALAVREGILKAFCEEIVSRESGKWSLGTMSIPLDVVYNVFGWKAPKGIARKGESENGQ